MTTAQKITICLTTADDREMFVKLPTDFEFSADHAVRFPGAEEAPGAILINDILVDEDYIDGLASVREEEIFLQFFETMPAVSKLISIIAALKVVQDEGMEAFAN